MFISGIQRFVLTVISSLYLTSLDLFAICVSPSLRIRSWTISWIWWWFSYQKVFFWFGYGLPTAHSLIWMIKHLSYSVGIYHTVTVSYWLHNADLTSIMSVIDYPYHIYLFSQSGIQLENKVDKYLICISVNSWNSFEFCLSNVSLQVCTGAKSEQQSKLAARKVYLSLYFVNISF